MSPSLIRRPRRVAILGAVLALGMLVGCTGQRDPKGYSDTVRKDFVAGCDASAFAGRANAKEMKAQALPTKQCECIYDAIEKDISFSDFSKANADRRDNASALDDPAFKKAFDSCGPDGPRAKGETTPTTEGKIDTTTSTKPG